MLDPILLCTLDWVPPCYTLEVGGTSTFILISHIWADISLYEKMLHWEQKSVDLLGCFAYLCFLGCLTDLYYHWQYTFILCSFWKYFSKKHLALEFCDSDFEITCPSLLTSREAIGNLDEGLELNFGDLWNSVKCKIPLLKIGVHLINIETVCCCIKHCSLIFDLEYSWAQVK